MIVLQTLIPIIMRSTRTLRDYIFMNAYLAKATGRPTHAKYYIRSILIGAEEESPNLCYKRQERLCIEVQRVFHMYLFPFPLGAYL
jgi:hypothetical protein